MPTLLEAQRALHDSLVTGEDAAAARQIMADDVSARERLAIHRGTFMGSLTAVLREGFPAVERLVGAAFFEHAARVFIERSPPSSAYLNDYGARFPAFLGGFPPAASLAYLADVARLEWAVHTAFHAPDAEPLHLDLLAQVAARDHGRIVLVLHPSVTVVRAGHRVDEIWRAVLARDDAALAALDPSPAPVSLLVERSHSSVDVGRIEVAECDFLALLSAGCPLEEAIREVPGFDASAALAGHFAAGRFVDFTLADPRPASSARAASA